MDYSSLDFTWYHLWAEQLTWQCCEGFSNALRLVPSSSESGDHEELHLRHPSLQWNGMWVFDDERVGLDKEPFVAGADTMIDTAVAAKVSSTQNTAS